MSFLCVCFRTLNRLLSKKESATVIPKNVSDGPILVLNKGVFHHLLKAYSSEYTLSNQTV